MGWREDAGIKGFYSVHGVDDSLDLLQISLVGSTFGYEYGKNFSSVVAPLGLCIFLRGR